jgi:hypothetical protein
MLICLLLSLTFVPTFANSFTDSNEKLEIVIILDVSGSMGNATGGKGSDPLNENTRFSIEAIKAFIWSCPADIDMNVSLIIFNGTSVIVTESVNVNNRHGRDSIIGTEDIRGDLDRILHGMVGTNNVTERRLRDVRGEKSTIPWQGNTDIEAALKDADEILNKIEDPNVKRGVLLFTDGEIEIQETAERSKRDSELNCVDIVKGFVTSNNEIKFYSVGLHGVGDTFNKDFLYELSGVDERVKDPFLVNLNEDDELQRIIHHFSSIFADFVGATIKEEPDSVSLEGEPQPFSFNIYGEITREVNISIVTPRAMERNVRVYDAAVNGNDMTDTDMVNINYSQKLVHIKILKPTDGKDWTIIFTGNEGDTAEITQIHLYDLSLRCVRHNNNDNKFDIFLYNEITRERVILPRIYENANLTATLVDRHKREHLVDWEINEKGDGYEIDLSNIGLSNFEIMSGIHSLRILLEEEGYFWFREIYYEDDVQISICSNCKFSVDKCECHDLSLCQTCNLTSVDCECPICSECEFSKDNCICPPAAICSECVFSINDCICYICLECGHVDGKCICPCECGKKCCEKCNGTTKCDVVNCDKCYPVPAPWGLIITIALIGTAFAICIIFKVTHKIRFEDVEELFYVSDKNPLFITTNEDAKYKNQYIISAHNHESLKGNDLVKIEAMYSLLPLPIFFGKLKITSLIFDESKEIKMESSISDLFTPPQDDVELTFSSGGDSLTIRFDCYTKSASSDDSEKSDVDEEEQYESENYDE